MAKDEEKLIDEPMTKKDKIIVGTIFGVASVVLIILIVAIAQVVLEQAGGNGGKTPESTFRSLIDGMDHGDFMEVYEASVFSLNMTYGEFMNALGDDMTQADFDITIKHLEVIEKADMSLEQTLEFEMILPVLELAAGSTIEDYCLMDFTINMTRSGDGGSYSEDISDTIQCVMTESRWYLVFPEIEYS